MLKGIDIQNVHPKLKVKRKAIRLLVEKILTSEKADSSVDVIFVDDAKMKQLNRRFTRREKTTDVLSFGMREGQACAIEYPSLGDVYVSLDQAKRQAEEYGVGFHKEVEHLVVHGVLHLLGYDHKGKKEEGIMRQKEQMYLQKMEKFLSKSRR